MGSSASSGGHSSAVLDNWILFGFAFLSWVCTVLNLLILRRLCVRHGQWSGYLLLITSMALCQLIYDTSFMMRVLPGYSACVAWHFLGNLGGLGASFWTNAMCVTVFYVLTRVQSLSIFKYYPLFFAFATLVPLAFAVVSIFAVKHTDENDDGTRGYLYCTFKSDALAAFVNNFYYWGRIASILMNFFAFVFSWVRLHRMGVQPYLLVNSAQAAAHHNSHSTFSHSVFNRSNLSQNGDNNSNNSNSNNMESISPPTTTVLRRNNDPQHVALNVLVSRMKYYPLWQALCRFAAAWNEYDNYRYSTPGISIFAAICSPSLGVCMFVVFLVVQPKAWDTLLEMFGFHRENPNLKSAEHHFRREFDFRRSSVAHIEDLSEDNLVDIIDDVDRAAKYKVTSVDSDTPFRFSVLASRHLITTAPNFDPDARRSSSMVDLNNRSTSHNPILDVSRASKQRLTTLSELDNDL